MGQWSEAQDKRQVDKMGEQHTGELELEGQRCRDGRRDRQTQGRRERLQSETVRDGQIGRHTEHHREEVT